MSERIITTNSGLELISSESVREARAKTAETELREIETDPDRQLVVAAENELIRLQKISANIAVTKPRLIAAKLRAQKNLDKKYGTGELESRIDLSEVRRSLSAPVGKLALAAFALALVFWVAVHAPTSAPTETQQAAPAAVLTIEPPKL
jgi:hypothetical protein